MKSIGRAVVDSIPAKRKTKASAIVDATKKFKVEVRKNLLNTIIDAIMTEKREEGPELSQEERFAIASGLWVRGQFPFKDVFQKYREKLDDAELRNILTKPDFAGTYGYSLNGSEIQNILGLLKPLAPEPPISPLVPEKKMTGGNSAFVREDIKVASKPLAPESPNPQSLVSKKKVTDSSTTTKRFRASRLHKSDLKISWQQLPKLIGNLSFNDRRTLQGWILQELIGPEHMKKIRDAKDHESESSKIEFGIGTQKIRVTQNQVTRSLRELPLFHKYYLMNLLEIVGNSISLGYVPPVAPWETRSLNAGSRNTAMRTSMLEDIEEEEITLQKSQQDVFGQVHRKKNCLVISWQQLFKLITNLSLTEKRMLLNLALQGVSSEYTRKIPNAKDYGSESLGIKVFIDSLTFKEIQNLVTRRWFRELPLFHKCYLMNLLCTEGNSISLEYVQSEQLNAAPLRTQLLPLNRDEVTEFVSQNPQVAQKAFIGPGTTAFEDPETQNETPDKVEDDLTETESSEHEVEDSSGDATEDSSEEEREDTPFGVLPEDRSPFEEQGTTTSEEDCVLQTIGEYVNRYPCNEGINAIEDNLGVWNRFLEKKNLEVVVPSAVPCNQGDELFIAIQLARLYQKGLPETWEPRMDVAAIAYLMDKVDSFKGKIAKRYKIIVKEDKHVVKAKKWSALLKIKAIANYIKQPILMFYKSERGKICSILFDGVENSEPIIDCENPDPEALWIGNVEDADGNLHFIAFRKPTNIGGGTSSVTTSHVISHQNSILKEKCIPQKRSLTYRRNYALCLTYLALNCPPILSLFLPINMGGTAAVVMLLSVDIGGVISTFVSLGLLLAICCC